MRTHSRPTEGLIEGTEGLEIRDWKHEQPEISKREIMKRVMTEEKWKELSKEGTETYMYPLHHCPPF